MNAAEHVRRSQLDVAAACDDLADAISARATARWWWPRLTLREMRRINSLMTRADYLRSKYGR